MIRPLLRSLAAIAALIALPSIGAAQYFQLVDLPTLQQGGGGDLNNATIDGDTGYAVLSGGGVHRVVQIDDIGGANSVTTLVSTTEWNTAVGSSPSGIAGTLFSSGGNLLIADLVTDQVISIDKATGAATLLVDNTTLGGNVGFSGLDNSDGNLLVYRSNADSLVKTNGAINGISTLLTDTEIAAIAGDDTPAGVTADGSGVIYFGQSTASVGENVTFFDPSDDSSGTLLTEADIVGGDDVGFSNTAFDFLPELGVLAFRDGGTNDSIKTVDPSDALATVGTLLDEATLVAGPATSDFVGNFTSFGGGVAWVQFIGAGEQVPGIYGVVPEPTTALLGAIALAGFAATHRR